MYVYTRIHLALAPDHQHAGYPREGGRREPGEHALLLLDLFERRETEARQTEARQTEARKTEARKTEARQTRQNRDRSETEAGQK